MNGKLQGSTKMTPPCDNEIDKYCQEKKLDVGIITKKKI